MNEIQLIADQIAACYRTGAWSDVSVRHLLHHMSAEEAASHPLPGVHSAWEIALHLAYWHDVVRRRVSGEAVDYEAEEDWPAPAGATDANWQAARDTLDRAVDGLVDTVHRLKPGQLADNVAGQKITVYYTLHGIAQHTLYHAGQVSLLRKALRSGAR